MSSLIARLRLSAAVALLAPSLAFAQTRTITFDAGGAGGALAVGSILSNQYAGVGVTFAPNGFSGSGGPYGDWSANTDMTIVSSTGPDIAALGTPELVSGNLLRSFKGWIAEADEDPSFSLTFSDPFIDFVEMDFAGITNPSNTRMFIYSGTTLLSTQTAGALGQSRLTFTALAGQYISKVIVTPGDATHWVGVDNITFRNADASVVPEPGTWALMSTGLLFLGGVAARRRRTGAEA